MATFRATLTIEIERANGEKTVVSEVVAVHGGDNIRFERSESEEAAMRAMRRVLHRVDPEFARA